MADPTLLGPDEAANAIGSGKVMPAGPVEMLDDKGVPTTVEPQGVRQALQSGYKISTKEANDHLADLHEAGQHPLEAGLEGAARGAVPLAPSILNALGDPTKNQELRHEANPIASKIGEVGGNIGQAVAVGALTGGAGDVAEAASAGSRILDAADMAKQAAMFAGQGASNELNEQDLGDHGYNGEAILSQAGLGAALGAASSPAFAFAKEVLPNPVALAGNAISKASDAIGSAMGKAAAFTRPGIEGVEGAAKDIFEAGAAGTPEAGRALENQRVTEVKQNFEKLGDAIDKNVSHAYETLRPAQIDALAADDTAMGGHDLAKTKAGLDAFRSNAIDPTLAKLQQLAEDGKVSKNLVGHLETAAKDFSENSAEMNSVSEGVGAAQRLGTYLDKNVMKYATDPSPEVSDVIREIEQNIRTPLRKLVREPEVFGPKVAEANGMLADKIHAIYQSQGALYKKMGITNLLADGRPADMRELSESKFLTHIRGEDKLSQVNNRAILDRVVQDAGDLNQYTARMAREGNQVTNSDEIDNLVKSAAESRAKASAASSLNSGFGYSVGGFGPEAVASGLGHMSGIPGAGPIAAGLTRGIRAAYHPSGALQTLGKIKGLADKHTAQIAKSAANFFVNAGKLTAPAIANNALKAGRDYQDHDSDTEKHIAEIRNLTSNPQLLQNTLMKNTSALTDGAPMHSMAVQTNAMARLSVIKAAMPPKPPQGMIPQKYPRSIDADQHFQRTLQIANHPTRSITSAMADETCTPDMVAAADACAPKSMAALRSAFQSEMVDRHDQSYSLGQQLMLSTLFKVPVTQAVSPQQVMFQQSTFAQTPPPPGGGQGAPKPSVSGMAKLDPGKQLATPSQKRQMEAAS